jgi:hypothetical protein
MIKRIFIALSLVAMVSASLRADELSIKISLGIRDSKLLGIKDVAYPLAFRIENTGKTVIKGEKIPELFFESIVHVLAKDRKEQQADVEKIWNTMIYDLKPGATFESPIVGDLLTFFPSAKDGDYQVWWTLGDLKSNVLHFTVAGGKVQLSEQRPN